MKKANLKGKRGSRLLSDPELNKGLSFTERERDVLGIRGLLPPKVFNQDFQLKRVVTAFRSKLTSLGKFTFLSSLRTRNEKLFYKFVISNLEEAMPIIYTPTVGLACQRYTNIYRCPEGLFISYKDRGHIESVLKNWHHSDIRIIVVTDGERILGLGDLGANGMGIPIGKLSLYVACAGINPGQCLPIVLDVGTNNEDLLSKSLYIGNSTPRITGQEYDDFIDEFVNSVSKIFPYAILQFEDFANKNALRLLNKYKDKVCTFNDDIQGTASVSFAGVYASLPLFEGGKGSKLSDHKFLLFGAGSAGIGIGELIVTGLKSEGMSEKEARKRCWYFDSKGLVVKSNLNLSEDKIPFAHEHPNIKTLEEAIRVLKPTALIGAAGAGRKFTQPIIELMTKNNPRPIIFALSNPTSQAECSAEDAYTWSDGKAIFASGSPFSPVVYNGKTYVPGQGNNAYIFPGIGLGAVTSEATRITDEMFFIAAKVLGGMVTSEDLSVGRIYPSLKIIRQASLKIAIAVAENVFEKGLTKMTKPDNLPDYIESIMYNADYNDYV